MLSIMWYLRDGLRYLRNQRGAETAEWIVIVGLIAVVAFLIYAAPAGPLATGLSQLVTDTVNFISTALSTAFGS